MSVKKTFSIQSIARGTPLWLYQTTERYRIDEHTINQLAATAAVPDDGTACATLLSRCDKWIKTVLFNQHSNAPLRITRHLMERAREYENKRSRCGTYIELLSEERQLIEQLQCRLCANSLYKIVEIGLNGDKNVCKIALLLPFSQWLDDDKESKRKLFLLIGCDGGVKTFYTVPDRKWRYRYHMDAGIAPLDQSAMRAMEQNARRDAQCVNNKYTATVADR